MSTWCICDYGLCLLFLSLSDLRVSTKFEICKLVMLVVKWCQIGNERGFANYIWFCLRCDFYVLSRIYQLSWINCFRIFNLSMIKSYWTNWFYWDYETRLESWLRILNAYIVWNINILDLNVRSHIGHSNRKLEKRKLVHKKKETWMVIKKVRDLH